MASPQAQFYDANLWRSYLLNRRLLTESTVTSYEIALSRIERALGKSRCNLTAYDLETFLGLPGLSRSAKQQSIVAARIHHKWGARQKWWPYDPAFEDIRLRKLRRRSRRHLNLEQVQLLLRLPRSPIRARLIGLGLYAGLRLGEMVALRESAWIIGLDGSCCLAVDDGTKGSVPREIPLHPALLALKDEINSESPTRRQLQRAAAALRPLLEIDNFTPHWLRHTYSRALQKSGTDRFVIGALLGHAPRGVTDEVYAPPTWAEMVEAMRRLDYGTGQMALF